MEERRADPLSDQLGDFCLEEERLAEIAPQQVADPDRELLENRPFRPSLSRIAATSCEVALSPAMMAARSPVVSRSSMKTTTATAAHHGNRGRPPAGGRRQVGRRSSPLTSC
jgi:hypothetical protein